MRNALKKVVRVVVLVVVVIAVLAAAFLAAAAFRENNYYQFVKPGGPVEQRYIPLGPEKVEDLTTDVPDKPWKLVKAWYPTAMKTSRVTFPVVVMANGTGYTASHYDEVFHHLASWGFIVVGNEDQSSRTGESTEATLAWILAQNDDPSSIFHGKVDTAHIGVAGHSQGGVGAAHAATVQPSASRYKAVWMGSPTSPYWGQADVFGVDWSYDMSKMAAPVLIVAGTGPADAGAATDITAREGQGICPLWGMAMIYDKTPATTPKVMARLKGEDHGQLARDADGYMTAWFMYWLKGDVEAKAAFAGGEPEIASNTRWQDVRMSIP